MNCSAALQTKSTESQSPSANVSSQIVDDAVPLCKVAYVMSRFPKLTETFVLFEILAVEQQRGSRRRALAESSRSSQIRGSARCDARGSAALRGEGSLHAIFQWGHPDGQLGNVSAPTSPLPEHGRDDCARQFW